MSLKQRHIKCTELKRYCLTPMTHKMTKTFYIKTYLAPFREVVLDFFYSLNLDSDPRTPTPEATPDGVTGL